MLAGRDISTTKMAFGSSRVMGTCSVGGQAVGTAAAMAARYGCTPRQMSEHMDELQQKLLRDDCYLPGFSNHDTADKARTAIISASGWTGGNEPEKVINGVSRAVGEESNCWEAALGAEGASITLELDAMVKIRELQLTFDPNLSREIMPSLTKNVRDRQVKGMPVELVKDYSVRMLRNGSEVFSTHIKDNYQRVNHVVPDKGVQCDQIVITVYNTHGIDRARIFEIRAY